MLKLTLHTHFNKNKPPKDIILYLTTNFTITPLEDSDNCNAVVRDGVLNNGGWHVTETIEQIEQMVDDQL